MLEGLLQDASHQSKESSKSLEQERAQVTLLKQEIDSLKQEHEKIQLRSEASLKQVKGELAA